MKRFQLITKMYILTVYYLKTKLCRFSFNIKLYNLLMHITTFGLKKNCMPTENVNEQILGILCSNSFRKNIANNINLKVHLLICLHYVKCEMNSNIFRSMQLFKNSELRSGKVCRKHNILQGK